MAELYRSLKNTATQNSTRSSFVDNSVISASHLFQHLLRLQSDALNERIIIGDCGQRRRDRPQFQRAARVVLLPKRDHLRVEAEPVVSMQKVQPAAFIHRVGDGEEDVGQRVDVLLSE